jgi:hypothetical protein
MYGNDLVVKSAFVAEMNGSMKPVPRVLKSQMFSCELAGALFDLYPELREEGYSLRTISKVLRGRTDELGCIPDDVEHVFLENGETLT